VATEHSTSLTSVLLWWNHSSLSLTSAGVLAAAAAMEQGSLGAGLSVILGPATPSADTLGMAAPATGRRCCFCYTTPAIAGTAALAAGSNLGAQEDVAISNHITSLTHACRTIDWKVQGHFADKCETHMGKEVAVVGNHPSLCSRHICISLSYCRHYCCCYRGSSTSLLQLNQDSQSPWPQKLRSPVTRLPSPAHRHCITPKPQKLLQLLPLLLLLLRCKVSASPYHPPRKQAHRQSRLQHK
jgi:hypothetical protein